VGRSRFLLISTVVVFASIGVGRRYSSIKKTRGQARSCFLRSTIEVWSRRLKSQSAVTASRYVVATLPSLQPMHHPLGEGCEFRHIQHLTMHNGRFLPPGLGFAWIDSCGRSQTPALNTAASQVGAR
jgi:hypothetical protein